MNKPRALDLFCGAGGATCGLQMAGFDVTGIDHRPTSMSDAEVLMILKRSGVIKGQEVA